MNELPKEYNYELGFIILWHLGLGTLPEQVTVQGFELLRKPEFHISLVCAYKLAQLIDLKNKQRVEKEIVDEFKKFVGNQSLAAYKLLPEFRFAQREHKKTLVVMTEVPGLSDFFDTLRQKFQIDLPSQPAHITLYALQPNAGIRIFTDEELQHDSIPVEVPELRTLLS
ncbi:MAG TPA: hypothetical protein VK694_07945 [Verrucomicrobiae bacterium]|nr:hypothetical protein [Verrucomicrobiae bacterium]